MALSVELKHVTKLKNGSYLFRRRLPAKVFKATGHEFFETTMRNKDLLDVT